ncbi:MAG: DUF3108 domain-containing protein [Roseibium sp.]
MRLPFLMVFLVFLAGPANARGIVVKYDGSLMGMKIGEAHLSLDLKDESYSISGQGKMAALGSLLSNGQGTAHSKGVLASGKLMSALYNLNAQEGGKPNTVSLKLDHGDVTSREINPPQDRMSERIKVTNDHTRGVIDPLSAVVFAAPKGIHRDSCNRTIQIYDGRDRFDVVMSYKSRYRIKGRKKRYSGEVLACSARYKPISGHRPNRRTIKELAANKTMEVHLSEIPGTPYLLLYRASLMTSAGKAVLQNVKFYNSN